MTAVEVRDSPAMRTKSLRIPSRVEPLDDLLPSAPADQAAGDHRLAEGLQGARHVDALAAGQGEALAGPVAKARD
jgi:hypothetical protein